MRLQELKEVNLKELNNLKNKEEKIKERILKIDKIIVKQYLKSITKEKLYNFALELRDQINPVYFTACYLNQDIVFNYNDNKLANKILELEFIHEKIMQKIIRKNKIESLKLEKVKYYDKLVYTIPINNSKIILFKTDIEKKSKCMDLSLTTAGKVLFKKIASEILLDTLNREAGKENLQNIVINPSRNWKEFEKTYKKININ